MGREVESDMARILTLTYGVASYLIFLRRRRPQAELRFVTPILYRFVRHPLYGSRLDILRGMPRPARRTAVTAMWVGLLMSSVVLAEIHWAAALATIGLGAIGTLTIVFGIELSE
jgi:uncharacterized membrane protein YbaN (DUF454 family)